MLAGARRLDDLLGVLRVRRAEHYALHLRVAQHRVQRFRQRHLLSGSKFGSGRRRIGDAHDAQFAARLRERHDDAAPPAEADDGDVEHQSGVAPASLAIFAQRWVSAATYFANSAGLALVTASAPPFLSRAMTS